MNPTSMYHRRWERKKTKERIAGWADVLACGHIGQAGLLHKGLQYPMAGCCGVYLVCTCALPKYVFKCITVRLAQLRQIVLFVLDSFTRRRTDHFVIYCSQECIFVYGCPLFFFSPPAMRSVNLNVVFFF